MTGVRAIAAAAALSMLAVLSPALAGGAGAASEPAVDVIVVLEDGYARGGHAANRQRAAEVARSHGLQPSHTYGSALFGFAASVPEGRLRGLEEDPRVSSIHDDGVVHALEHPTGVKRIDADDVQATTGGPTGAGISVAILDTGIAAHDDLPNIGTGTSCIAGTTTHDDHGHGTHVAGTVGASAASSVTGVAPGVTLLPVKVLDSSGSGAWSEVICGVDWVTSQNAGGVKVHVANLSLGAAGSYSGEVCDDGAGDPLFDALCTAIGSGATFTVAAGNDGTDASGFVPAAHPLVVTVSAYSDTDGVANGSTSCSGRGLWKTCDESFASFSNHGAVVDVIAPGVNIESTTNDGKTGTKSGTSMAAPHVAGVVALMLEASPGLSPAAVEAHLLATGQCPDTEENPGTGTCAGLWHNDPDGITEPMANAVFAVQGLSSGGGDANGAPVADDDTVSTQVGGTASIAVLGNDADPDGDALTVTSVTTPTNGTATINADGTVTYVHDGSDSTGDSFTYTVSDGNGGSDTAIVTITVSSSTGGIWVSHLDGYSTSLGSTWSSRATIQLSTATSGAVVRGTWDGADVVECTTGTDGSCQIDGPTVKKNVGSVTFTVTNVVDPDRTYDPSRNADPDGDSDGTTITIAKP